MNRNTLEDLLTSKSFVLWLKGKGSSEDQEYWEAWMEENPEHEVLAEEARNIVAAFRGEEFNIPDPLDEVEKLNDEIDRYESQQRQLKLSSYKQGYRSNRGAIAAGIALLIICLGSFFAYQVYQAETDRQTVAHHSPVQKYDTGYGEKITFRLSDGSRIILNANSHLTFSSANEKGINTEVRLEGEAYFDIARREGDRQRTFTVHTRDGAIQVLGTRFAVNTFGKQTRAVLEEGKIRVRTLIKDGSSDTSTQHVLKSGEMARFMANDNKIAIKEINTRIYTSWTEDKLIFEHTSMQEVAQRIENTFGVEVLVRDELKQEKLTGSIKSNNLEVLIEALSEILKEPIEKKDQRLLVGIEN